MKPETNSQKKTGSQKIKHDKDYGIKVRVENKFCSALLSMVTSPREWDIIELDDKDYAKVIKQNSFYF